MGSIVSADQSAGTFTSPRKFGASGGSIVQGESLTTQQRFERMMRDIVAPALRTLGMSGTYRDYLYRRNGCVGSISLQKSRWNTKDRVALTFHVMAAHEGEKRPFWDSDATALFPDLTAFWWQLIPSTDVAEFSEILIRDLSDFLFVAVDTALDAPWIPTDTSETLVRDRVDPEMSSSSRSRLEYFEPAQWSDDEVVESLSGKDEGKIFHALMQINRRPQTWRLSTSSAVRRVLESDRIPRNREWAARVLGRISKDADVDDVLNGTAVSDENYQVRWGARYTLALRNSGVIFEPNANREQFQISIDR